MTLREIILSWQKSGQKFVVFVFFAKNFPGKTEFSTREVGKVGRWGDGEVGGV
jgi:hypothetical protein